VDTVIDRLIPELTPIWPALMIIAYAVGGVLVLSSGLQAAHAGARHGAMGRGSMFMVIMTFFCGVLLLNFPTWMDTLAMTLFNSSSEQSLSYTAPSHEGSSYVTFAVRFVRIIGVIGILRGILLLRASAADSKVFFKAVTHLIGGILCVNIVQFLNAIGTSAGGDVQSTIAMMIGT
jgi:hypothetical protein